MRLWQCDIKSGSTNGSYHRTVYVVGVSYEDVEKTLLSDKNTYWAWNHGHKIVSIKCFSEPVIVSERYPEEEL